MTRPSDGPAAVSSSDVGGGVDRRTGGYGPFAVATVTMALIVWPIAFNLGAFDAVFYDDVFRFVVASFAGLLVTFFAPPYAGRKLWHTRAALASPVAWLALSVALFDSTAAAASDPVFGWLALFAALVSVPAVFVLLIQLFVPEVTLLRSTRLVVSTVGVLLVVAVAGWLVGANNDAFLTCDDFKTAGSDEPANCAKS